MSDRLRRAFVVAGGVALCLALVWMGTKFPQATGTLAGRIELPFPDSSLQPQDESAFLSHAWFELSKLVAAGLVGILVTTVHRRYQKDRPLPRSLMQAEILLCVCGALMMIIIGNSAARALGIAGGASIVRFRTPLEDPKDAMILFVLLGLGMSVGLGAFAVCGLSTIFVCLFLAVLNRFGDQKPRTLFLELVATSPEFPNQHVNEVLSANVDFFEPLKVSRGNEAAARFNVKLDPGCSLAYLSDRLMDGGLAGLKSVTWEEPKKKD